jgi:hypothetical protein
MSAFARFVLRDNGLAIHIAPHHVTQVRETGEGDPAIYLAGKDTPLMVEGDLEDALRRLQAAAQGVALAEPAPEPEPEPEPLATAPVKAAKARKPKAAKAKSAVVAAPARIAGEEDNGESSWFMGAR